MIVADDLPLVDVAACVAFAEKIEVVLLEFVETMMFPNFFTLFGLNSTVRLSRFVEDLPAESTNFCCERYADKAGTLMLFELEVVNCKLDGSLEIGIVIVIGTFCVFDCDALFTIDEEDVAELLLLMFILFAERPVVTMRGGFNRGARILLISCWIAVTFCVSDNG